MPPRSGFATRVGAVLNHQAPRSDTRHGDVRLERMSASADGPARHHMNHEAPAERHVQALRQWGKSGVGFDLQLVPRDENTIEPQPSDPDQHCRARAIFQSKAQALPLRAEAVKVGQPLREVARYLWAVTHRWLRRRDREQELGAVDDATRQSERCLETVLAFGGKWKAERRRADG